MRPQLDVLYKNEVKIRAEETGDDYYRGGYANAQSDQHHASPPRQESQPKWAQGSRQHSPPPQQQSPSSL